MTAGAAALLLATTSPAWAVSYRYNDLPAGPGGHDTMRVRIIWDSSIVDGDMI